MYCTVESIKLRKQLPESIGVEVIQEAIFEAAQIIDNKLRGVYDVPFSPVPGEIKRIATTLAHCILLYDRKILLAEGEEMMAGTKEYCNKARQDLEDLRVGAAHLGTNHLHEYSMLIRPGRTEWEYNG